MAKLYLRPESQTYYVHVFHQGKQHKIKIGKDKSDAELALKEIEIKKIRGTFEPPKNKRRGRPNPTLDALTPEENSSTSLKAFMEKYLHWSKRTNSKLTYSDDHGVRIPRFVTFLGELRAIESVKPEEIEAFKISRAVHAKPATVWGDLKTVKAFFQKAVDWEYLVKNPAKTVKLPKVPEKEVCFLNEEEVKALLKESRGSKVQGVVGLGAFAGLRKQEIEWLEWKDIDLKKKVIRVHSRDEWNTKNYKSRSVPLHSTLADVLKALPRLSRWVVANNNGSKYSNNMLRDVKKVAKKLDLEVTVHLLRHTFASQLVMKGVSIYKVSKWLGHASVKTTQRYAHLAASDEDIERL